MDVSGAAVPSVGKMEVGLLISALAWLRTEPAMKDPRNTVMNCITGQPHIGKTAWTTACLQVTRVSVSHPLPDKVCARAFFPIQVQFGIYAAGIQSVNK